MKEDDLKKVLEEVKAKYGTKARLYEAQTDAAKPSTYSGEMVDVRDNFAIQQLNDRTFIVHEGDGFTEGDNVKITYTSGERTIEARTPKEPVAPGAEAESKEPMVKKTMTEIDNDKYTDIANRILDSMDKGNTIWQKPWKPSGLINRPYNPSSETKFSGMNRVILTNEMIANGWTDTRFMTYKQVVGMASKMAKDGVEADKLPHIKKGSQSIEIYKFGRTEPKPTPVLDEAGKPVLDDEGNPKMKQARARSFLQSHRVFNAASIENMPPLPEREAKPSWQVFMGVDELAQEMGVKVEKRPGDSAFYVPGKDLIVLPEEGQFKNRADFYAVYLHEATHATGAESRLNRDLSGGFGSNSYAYEELVAETGSAFLASELGLTDHFEEGHNEVFQRHVAYLEVWKQQLKEHPKDIFRAMGEAEQAADFFMGRHALQAKADKEEQKDHFMTLEHTRSVSNEEGGFKFNPDQTTQENSENEISMSM